MGSFRRFLAAGQGIYYALTGAWPWLSLDTFVRITGPKTDTWLVQTVGLLVLAIAVPLLVASARDQVDRHVRLLAGCTAAAFVWVDVWFYARNVIGPIYLADAAVEAVMLLAWVVLSRDDRTPTSPP